MKPLSLRVAGKIFPFNLLRRTQRFQCRSREQQIVVIKTSFLIRVKKKNGLIPLFWYRIHAMRMWLMSKLVGILDEFAETNEQRILDANSCRRAESIALPWPAIRPPSLRQPAATECRVGAPPRRRERDVVSEPSSTAFTNHAHTAQPHPNRITNACVLFGKCI